MGCVWIVRLCYCGFELGGATLSPTRISRCPDQSNNLHSLALEQGVLHTCPSLQEWKCVSVCAKVYVCVFFFFNGPWIKSVVFFISWLVCVFPLICTPLLSLSEAMCLVTLSSYTEPVSTPITSTTLVCWNGLRLLFIVLLLLDSSQLYSVSTVPVEPWGVTLETSVSYQHYQCSVSVDL